MPICQRNVQMLIDKNRNKSPWTSGFSASSSNNTRRIVVKSFILLFLALNLLLPISNHFLLSRTASNYLSKNGLTRASNLSGTLFPSPVFLTI